MDARGSHPATLLVHDGELVDVRALLDELDAPLIECRGLPAPREAAIDWGLVVATPKRMLEIGALPATASQRVRIAVADSWSRTLKAAMGRMHADFVVGRPVHPEALRLLLLRALYRGPERRRAPRVAVGRPAHFRAQRKLKPATLLDISLTGCRLLAAEPCRLAEEITAALPTESGRTLSIRGRVVRVAEAQGGNEGAVLHVAFDALTPHLRARVAELVEEFGEGPARLPGDPRARGSDAANQDPDEDLPALRLLEGADGEDSERRNNNRRIFSRRVIAQRDDATRVLIGRDISPGGMRIERHPELEVGDQISLALPLPAERVPLVLMARVVRDDGNGSQVIQFDELGEELEARLRRSLGFLPNTDSPFGQEEPAWVIVSEILERRTS